MKIGLISDIHGNAPALSAVLNNLTGRVDHILFLGDFAGYYPFVNECIEMIPSGCMTGVRGNHDQILLDYLLSGDLPEGYLKTYGTALTRTAYHLSPRSLRILKALPVEKKVTMQGVSLTLVHGAPWDRLNGRIYPDFTDWDRFKTMSDDIIILGHTHHPMVKKIENKLIINPGSVGQPRVGRRGASFAELDLSTCQVQTYHIPYDAKRVIDDVRIHDPENAYLVRVLQ